MEKQMTGIFFPEYFLYSHEDISSLLQHDR